MIIPPRKARHVLAMHDICLSLTANYLHIDIPNRNLKKVRFFCVVLFLYMD